MSVTVFPTPANDVSTNVGPGGYVAGSGRLTLSYLGGSFFSANPLPPGGYYQVTVIKRQYANSANAPLNSYTIYKVTSVSGDTLTLSYPPLENTTDRSYLPNDVVEIRVTAGILSGIYTAINNIETYGTQGIPPTLTFTGDVSGTGSINITLGIGDGKVTNSMLAGSIAASKLIGTDLVIAESQVTSLTSDLSAKAPLASPTFTGTVTTAALSIGDGSNIAVGTVTGTKIGTATTQKLGFFNATPVVQQTGSISTALSNLGLVASPTIAEAEVTGLTSDLAAKAPLASPTFTGTVTTAALSIGDGSNISVGTATGTKIGTATTQKLGFFNATPVVQQTGSISTALSNLGLVASPTIAEAEVTGLTSDLAAKAPLASPTFTGTVTTAALSISDGSNIAVGTVTGTKIGTATTQKLGFFNATPVVQQTGNLITGLSNLGLVTSGTITEANVTNLTTDLAAKAPLASPTFTGTVTTAAIAIGDGSNIAVGTVTGTKIGTATTQKLGFFNATPVVQPTGSISTALSNLGLVASPTIAESEITNLTTDLAAKAPLASPTFTGTVTTAAVTIGDGSNIALGTTTGTKIGTATTQKLGFFNSIPIVQPTGNVSTALSNLGLISSPTIAEGDITGLTTDLAARALDSAVVHIAGTETITGAKTFSSNLLVSGASLGVGIAPTSTLHVKNSSSSGVQAAFGGSSSYIYIGGNWANGNPGIGTNDSNPMNLVINSNVAVRVDTNSGISVGSGSTSPPANGILTGGVVNINSASTAAPILLAGTQPAQSGSYSYSNWNATGSPVTAAISCNVNNGGTTPAAPLPVLAMSRLGVSGQSYTNYAELKLYRWENNGANARTGLDVALTHGLGDTSGTTVASFHSDGSLAVTSSITTSGITLRDATNIAVGTTTGTKIGTATTQKLGFFNATPVVQPTGSISTALSNLGLVASPTIAESEVTNLSTDLAARALDSAVVHIAGTETITGSKTFSSNVTVNGTLAGNVTSTSSSTSRSLANRFSEVVNVKDYGAVGNGTTDDSAAFLAALAQCSALSPSPHGFTSMRPILYIPTGTYRITYTLGAGVPTNPLDPTTINTAAFYVLTYSLTIKGNGSKLLLDGDANSWFLTTSPTNAISLDIDDLYVRPYNYTGTQAQSAFMLWNVLYSHWKNVFIHYFQYGVGLYLAVSERNLFEELSFENCQRCVIIGSRTDPNLETNEDRFVSLNMIDSGQTLTDAQTLSMGFLEINNAQSPMFLSGSWKNNKNSVIVCQAHSARVEGIYFEGNGRIGVAGAYTWNSQPGYINHIIFDPTTFPRSAGAYDWAPLRQFTVANCFIETGCGIMFRGSAAHAIAGVTFENCHMGIIPNLVTDSNSDQNSSYGFLYVSGEEAYIHDIVVRGTVWSDGAFMQDPDSLIPCRQLTYPIDGTFATGASPTYAEVYQTLDVTYQRAHGHESLAKPVTFPSKTIFQSFKTRTAAVANFYYQKSPNGNIVPYTDPTQNTVEYRDPSGNLLSFIDYYGNFGVGASAGVKIGTATTQKLGFFNQSPVVQPSGNLLTALGTSSGLGLISSPTIAESDVTNLTSDLALKAPLASPTFTGTVTTAAIAIGDGSNVAVGSTTGTKIGTATTQKLGFFNATPVVQQTGDLITGLSNLGLITSGTISEADVTNLTSDLALKAPLASPTFTGTVTTAAVTIGDGSNIAVGSTTGTKIGTATTQKLGFFNAAPVVQQTGSVVTGLSNLGLITSGTIAESDVTNLTTDLAAKALDSAVVHIAGTETVTGAKTFSANVVVSGASLGVGITPSFPFHLKNTATSSVQAAFGGNTAYLYLGGNWINGNPGIGTNDSNPVNIVTNNATAVRVDTNAGISVGSGNTSPPANGILTGGVVNINSASTSASILLAGTQPAQSGSYSYSNWNATGNPVTAAISCAVNNGGTTPAAALPALVLSRLGVSGQAYTNYAEFKIYRWENNSVNARTGLDIALTHGSGDTSGTTVASFHSDGSLAITSSVTASGLTLRDATNIAGGTTTGTKIGTATNQKLGFFNQAPVVQPSGNLLTALGTSSGLGLVSSPTIAESDVTNLTTDLAAKAPLASPTFTGTVVMPSYYGGITSDTDAATITFDAAVSNKHQVTLGGNRTLAITNDQIGQMFTILLKQDATGSRTVTWWSGILWSGGSAPTLTTTANKTDVITIIKQAAGVYLGAVLMPNC